MLHIILLLILSVANAHMPVFAPQITSYYDPFHIQTSGKSLGIYGAVNGVEWITLEVLQGEEMSISLQRNQYEGKYDIVIIGPGLNNITCEEFWVGWEQSNVPTQYSHDINSMPYEIQQAAAGQENIILKGNEIYDAQYEPFGVNVYWPLGGCKSTFPQNYTYRLAVVSSEKVQFSIGIGTKEAFSTGDLIIMSYMLFGTYTWAGRPAALLLLPHVLVVTFVIALRCYKHSTVQQILIDIGSALLIASSVAFLVQLLWCASLITLPESVWIAVVFHILMPTIIGVLILALFDRKSTLQKVLIFTAGILMSFLAWQAYVVGGLLLCIGAGIYFTI